MKIKMGVRMKIKFKMKKHGELETWKIRKHMKIWKAGKLKF